LIEGFAVGLLVFEGLAVGLSVGFFVGYLDGCGVKSESSAEHSDTA